MKHNQPTEGASFEYKGNEAWAVTEFGLECRIAMANGLTVPCDIDASRLLQIRDGTAGVSNCALHVASKFWCENLDEFLEAYAQALRVHHPNQTTVDLAATRERARAEWARSRPQPRDLGGLGHDYLEDAEARYDSYAARRRASTGGAGAAAADPAWLAAYPVEHHAVLRQYGMDPDDYPAARAYDQELIRRAEAGLAGQALEDAAAALWDEHFFVREKEEPEAPIVFDPFDD